MVTLSCDAIIELKSRHPNNIGLQCFEADYFNGLSPELQTRLLDCMNSGIENPQSEMGCYANKSEDYHDLYPYFSKVVARYHGVDENSRHHSDWNLPNNSPSSADGELDVTRFNLPPLSMRVRVARNVVGLPLPPAMTRTQRETFEDQMVAAFKQLSALPGFEGTYYSLTPDHPSFINDATYQRMVAQHLMFKSMQADPYLVSAGIASDWPVGRGCFVSKDRGFIIWVGEEDHLRIMAMANTVRLSDVFNRLKDALEQLSDLGIQFSTSQTFGTITSCPTNLGTGMRASVHMQIPNLVAQNSDSDLKSLARSLGLGIRGMGGEHTAFGEDGTVDLSPRARFGITEAEILSLLFTGIGELKSREDAGS